MVIKKWYAAFAAIAICGNVTPAQATLTPYLSLSSFEAVSGQTSLEDFNDHSPVLFAQPGSDPFPTGMSSFLLTANGNGDFVGIGSGSRPANIDGTNYLEFGEPDPRNGNYTGDGGTGPSITFNFHAATTAFAFDWVDLDPTDSYKVVINGIEFADPPFSTSGTGRGFFGVVATDGEFFRSVQIIQNASGGIVDPFGIDNVRSSVVVPEPSSIALAASALPIGLVAWKRRRKQA